MWRNINISGSADDVLISAIFVVRKRVKARFVPRSAIRLSTGLRAVMLPCSCVSPSDSDQGFYCCTLELGGGDLEPNRRIFRPGGAEAAIQSRDIIMKCKLEYCFYYKAKQMRLLPRLASKTSVWGLTAEWRLCAPDVMKDKCWLYVWGQWKCEVCECHCMCRAKYVPCAFLSVRLGMSLTHVGVCVWASAALACTPPRHPSLADY